MVQNVMNRPPVHTKTAHFSPEILKMVGFETELKPAHFGNGIVSALENEENRTFFDAFGMRLIECAIESEID